VLTCPARAPYFPRPCPLLIITPHVVAAYLAGGLHRAVFANDGPTPAVRTSLLIAIVVAVTLMNCPALFVPPLRWKPRTPLYPKNESRGSGAWAANLSN
jgi:hypothetical protein